MMIIQVIPVTEVMITSMIHFGIIGIMAGIGV